MVSADGGVDRYGIVIRCVAVEAELPERVHVALTSYWLRWVQVALVQVSVATPDELAVNVPEVRVPPPTLTRVTVQEAPGRV